MKLEEYVAKRKKEDGINEFDFDNRMENLRICTNYIFEYFNNYLETLPEDKKTVLQDKKSEKYRNMLINKGYSYEMTDWLVSIYAVHGNQLDRVLMNMTKEVEYFLLYTTDAEFRALSYDIYSKAIKRYSYLEGQSEMIFKYLKEAHNIRNKVMWSHYITEEIEEWISETHLKYGVNLFNFCDEWIDYFYENPEIWPKNCKKRSKEYYEANDKYSFDKNDPYYWEYDFKQGKNLFCIDSLFRRMPKKSFIRGKKQWIEATMLYCWLNNIIGDESDYWDEYCRLVFEN